MPGEDVRPASEENPGGQLLSPEERAICESVATGQPPYSQRAQALLALDEGATLAAAGQLAGQTPGQVRYWLEKFRERRAAIFPQEHFPQPAAEPAPGQVLPGRPTVAEGLDSEKPVKQSTKREKSQGAPADGKRAKKGKAKPKKKSKKAEKGKERENGKKKQGAKKGKKTKSSRNASGKARRKEKKG